MDLEVHTCFASRLTIRGIQAQSLEREWIPNAYFGLGAEIWLVSIEEYFN